MNNMGAYIFNILKADESSRTIFAVSISRKLQDIVYYFGEKPSWCLNGLFLSWLPSLDLLWDETTV